MRSLNVFVFFFLIISIFFNLKIYSKENKSGMKTHTLKDTLFEKTIWHKKVSHIVLEEKKEYYHVSVLMIIPYPHNYKSQNYRIYYEFNDYQEALEKFQWIHDFLKEDGILRVRIFGSKIIDEKILYENPSKTQTQTSQ